MKNFYSLYTINDSMRLYPKIDNTTNQKRLYGKYVLLIVVMLCFISLPKKGFSNGITNTNGAVSNCVTLCGLVHVDESAKDTSIDGSTVLSQPLIWLRTTLYGADASYTPIYLADGALNIFGSQYSNDVDWSKDVQKLFNFNEKVSILKDSQNLAIEKSALPQAGDTIYLNVSDLKQQPYQFVIQTNNFIRSDIQAFFDDAYTHTATPILFGNASIDVNFTIDGNPAGYASNRFMIVFIAAPGSVDSTKLIAAVQDKNIDVQWKIANQVNIKEYTIERSVDGTNFTEVATMPATADTSAYTYSWLDINAIAGTDYYRVYAVANNLVKEDTSNVATAVLKEDAIAPVVIVPTVETLIKLYPNPVTNGMVNVDLTNYPAGNYTIRIISGTGRVLLSETKYHGSNDGPVTIPFGKNFNTGIYMMEIIDPNGNKTKINFVNQ